jgi:polyisoprenyl-teichoic acid--peptidoglycan teichoic acid transferase
MTVGANATPTPTPFKPLAPTPTPVPTATPTPVPTSTLAIVAPEIAEPMPFEPVQPGGDLPEDVVNILVLGSDARPGGGYRTDVMMLVSINRGSGTVSVVSFPRDLYVNIPGWMTNRLNTAMQVGGFSTMADTFQSNFGVRPTYYVMTNFAGFKGIIDSMGGIDVKVEKSLYDACDLPWADGAGFCAIEAPATVPMNGEDALWYVRSRHSSSDFDRLRRAQEVLRAIFVRLMSIDAIGRAPEIYDIYQNNVQTNLTLDQILPLIPLAQGVMQDTGLIRRYAISPAQAVPYITPEGAMVLWPNLPAIQAIVYEAVYQ